MYEPLDLESQLNRHTVIVLLVQQGNIKESRTISGVSLRWDHKLRFITYTQTQPFKSLEQAQCLDKIDFQDLLLCRTHTFDTFWFFIQKFNKGRKQLINLYRSAESFKGRIFSNTLCIQLEDHWHQPRQPDFISVLTFSLK